MVHDIGWGRLVHGIPHAKHPQSRPNPNRPSFSFPSYKASPYLSDFAGCYATFVLPRVELFQHRTPQCRECGPPLQAPLPTERPSLSWGSHTREAASKPAAACTSFVESSLGGHLAKHRAWSAAMKGGQRRVVHRQVGIASESQDQLVCSKASPGRLPGVSQPGRWLSAVPHHASEPDVPPLLGPPPSERGLRPRGKSRTPTPSSRWALPLSRTCSKVPSARLSQPG